MRSLFQHSKLLLVGGTIALGLGSLLTSPAVAADQVTPAISPCSARPHHPNLMQGSANYSGVHVGMYLRTEPAAKCSTVDHTYIADASRVSMACWVTNYFGHTWVYVGQNHTYGWLPATHLTQTANLDKIGYACPNNGL